MRKRIFAADAVLAALLAPALIFAPPARAKSPERGPSAELGQRAPDFALTDSLGRERKLSAYKDKVVVLEWLNYDCPFVRKHYGSGNMQSLQQEYGAKGVVWLSVISSAPGRQGHYSAEEVNKKNKERDGRAAAILLDSQGTVGRLYDAKTTPSLYVIDQKGTLVYAGAIDDKPTTDVEDVKGARNYLREALDAVLSGKPVKTAWTKSYGCSVKY